MPYPVEGFLDICEDMVQNLLMLEVLVIQDSAVEDLFCVASSSSKPSLFVIIYLFGSRFIFLLLFSNIIVNWVS